MPVTIAINHKGIFHDTTLIRIDGKNRFGAGNHPMALKILEKLSRRNAYVFPGKVEGQPINNPIKAFKRIIKRAGIESSFR